MTLPPLWKISRELRRFGRQIPALPNDIFSYYFGARYYDRFLAHKARSFSGALPKSEHVAIFLIFPNMGLKPSHFHTLDNLASKGYATIVVSNIPLDLAERTLILEKCRTYIERPNYGYDFGGYREGILSLGNAITGLNRLVLLNDSVWFPVTQKTDWLADVEVMDVDFAAAASSFGIPRPNPENFREIRFDYRTSHKNFHYCSFALAFSKRLLADPKFCHFWNTFPLTNKKKRTVRRGEVGLTRWVLRRDYSHAASLDLTHLDQELYALETPRLAEILGNMIILEDNTRLQAVKHDALNQPGGPTREDMVRMILTGVARQGISYALADFNIFEQGFPFLKKSPVWLNEESSDITLALMKKLDGPLAEEMRQEALGLRVRRAPSFAQIES